MTTLAALSSSSLLRRAIETVGYDVVTRDGHRRIEPRAALRMQLPAHVGTHCPSQGILISVTEDGWLELQLDGETRRDEYLPSQVELAPVA